MPKRKVNIKPVMLRIEPKPVTDIWVTQSASDPAIKHITLKSKDGFYCTCKGFQLNEKCWHTQTQA